jgi:hypothetical protein
MDEDLKQHLYVLSDRLDELNGAKTPRPGKGTEKPARVPTDTKEWLDPAYDYPGRLTLPERYIAVLILAAFALLRQWLLPV